MCANLITREFINLFEDWQILFAAFTFEFASKICQYLTFINGIKPWNIKDHSIFYRKDKQFSNQTIFSVLNMKAQILFSVFVLVATLDATIGRFIYRLSSLLRLKITSFEFYPKYNLYWSGLEMVHILSMLYCIKHVNDVHKVIK